MTYWALQAAFMDERREGIQEGLEKGKEEGLREGIEQYILLCRNDMHLDDSAIKDKLMSSFQLSEEEAVSYMNQVRAGA